MGHKIRRANPWEWLYKFANWKDYDIAPHAKKRMKDIKNYEGKPPAAVINNVLFIALENEIDI